MEAIKKPTDASISLAIFIFVFAVYLLTLCPTIYPGLSADAVCDVTATGLTPAAEHPIWLILGRLVSNLSSNTAYILNLTSAFLGALTIALLYTLLLQFTHTRTAEEEVRYQTQPQLRRLVALSAALLVAFCHPFWEGSVLAGSDTLNTFFLVLLVFLLARYLKTSKSRYMIVFALVYGLAIGNYPTLFALAPIFILFLLLKCRALLDDPAAVVLMFILFGVGLLPALYGPHLYVLQGKDYVVQSKTFGQALSAFMNTYFRTMRLLFLQRTMFQGWFFWLFIPTFVPLLCLAMKGGEYERGGRTATKLTYLVRYAFFAAFMVGGLGYLWGFGLEPVKIADLNYLRDPRYLGAYVVVGAWLCYVIGYWIIVATGKFKPTGTEPEPNQKFRKAGYIVAAVLVLTLPAAGLVMNFGKSSKRHAKQTEQYALGLLKSSPPNAIIVVPIQPFFGSIGAPLRYFQSRSNQLPPGQSTTIVDLNAAYLDFITVKRMETERYLAETALGREVQRPRELFSPEQPFGRVYDGMLRCAAMRALETGQQPRPICGLVNNFFLSPLPGNDVMNRDYQAEPAGLLYVYRSRLHYRDKGEIIADNERLWKELWSDLALPDKRSGQAAPSEVEEYVLGEYSKSANDFGVFCQLAGQLDLTEKYYHDRALELAADNTSALWNMSLLMTQKGDEKRAAVFEKRYRSVMEKSMEVQRDLLRRFGLPIDFSGFVQLEKDLENQEDTEARRLAILQLAADLRPENSSLREKIGSLRETIGDDLLRSGGAASEQNARTEYLRARGEYMAALERAQPGDDPRIRRILGRLGDVFVKLGDPTQAERFLKRATAPKDIGSQLRLIGFYVTTGQNLPEVKRMATTILERTPAEQENKEVLAVAQKEAAMLLAKAILKAEGIDEARGFLSQYMSDHPEQADVLQTLATQLGRDPTLDTLTVWLLEEHPRIRKEVSIPSLARLAEIYFRQQQYDALSEMKEPPSAAPGLELAKFHYFKGLGYEAAGKNAEAANSYERALSILPDQAGGMGVVIANNLAWLYFKNGQIEEAKRLAEDALAKDPANPAVWDTYGWILYESGADLDKALELVARSHLANPAVGIIAYHYGKLLIEKGQPQKGMDLLEWAIEAGLQGKDELDDAKKLLESRLPTSATTDTDT